MKKTLLKFAFAFCIMAGLILGFSDVVSADAFTEQKVQNVRVRTIKGKNYVWWNPVEGANSYLVLASKYPDKEYKRVAFTPNNIVEDVFPKDAGAYYYVVYALSGRKHTQVSDPVTLYIYPTPPAVTGMTMNKVVVLNWSAIPGASGYNIWKKIGGRYVRYGYTTNAYFADQNVIVGNYYDYAVTAECTAADGTKFNGTYSLVRVIASNINPYGKMVALTYDDGPGPYTQSIVNCLYKNQAKATFFVQGKNVDSYRSAVRSAASIGCEIANHTYDHPNLANLSPASIKWQIQTTDQKIYNATGKKSALLRPPYGSSSATVRANAGKPLIMWSIDTRDWEHRNASKTVNAVLNNVKDGDIVLMHDIHNATMNASLTLIPALRKRGYQMVTVSELAFYRNIRLQKGSTYNSLRR